MIKVIGSAIIKNSEGKILSILLDKEESGGIIVPPGGELEQDESVRDCVVREVKEEIGVDIKINRLSGIAEKEFPEGYWIYLYFDAEIVSGEPKIMEPNKILEIRWIDITELKNYENIKWL